MATRLLLISASLTLHLSAVQSLIDLVLEQGATRGVVEPLLHPAHGRPHDELAATVVALEVLAFQMSFSAESKSASA